jgi:hypothetical protein
VAKKGLRALGDRGRLTEQRGVVDAQPEQRARRVAARLARQLLGGGTPASGALASNVRAQFCAQFVA